jgi:murein DD-endopeptidase MepM/ murein hydrolase activator NlpD
LLLKKNQTIYDRLTERYLLIFREEETFEEKLTLNLTIAKLIAGFSIVFLLMLVLSFLLITGILSRTFNPNYSESRQLRQLLDMRRMIDSLENELATRDIYQANLRKVLEGKTVESGKQQPNSSGAIADVNLDKVRPTDAAFRKEFESGEVDGTMPNNRNAARADFESLFLFTPLDGVVTNTFNIKNDHYGIDIVSKKDEPIRSVANGTVIFSSWTQDAGLVIAIQHKSHLVSLYKHNSQLYNKVGDIVRAGDIIAIVGNSGEQTDGPHLHFELWLDGNPIDPQEFLFLQ